MIRIKVDGMDKLQKKLGGLSDQIPFALSKAINDTAFKVRAAEQEEMRRAFVSPKPWTLQQVLVKKSTKKDLTAAIGTPSAISGTAPGRVDAILSPHIYGGERVNRKAEIMLQRMGMLPFGWAAVPSKRVKLDQFGNIPLRTWEDIAAWKKQGRLFVAIPGKARTRHLQPGVYRRLGTGKRYGGVQVEAVILFKRHASYRKRLDWYGRARKTVEQEFPLAVNEAINYAMRTAR